MERGPIILLFILVLTFNITWAQNYQPNRGRQIPQTLSNQGPWAPNQWHLPMNQPMNQPVNWQANQPSWQNNQGNSQWQAHSGGINQPNWQPSSGVNPNNQQNWQPGSQVPINNQPMNPLMNQQPMNQPSNGWQPLIVNPNNQQNWQPGPQVPINNQPMNPLLPVNNQPINNWQPANSQNWSPVSQAQNTFQPIGVVNPQNWAQPPIRPAAPLPITYPKSLQATTFTQSSCNRVRKSWDSLTENERNLFLQAIALLKESGIYDQFVGLHAESANHDYAHGGPGFFVWHRKFLLELENALRSLGPQFACVTLPYWPFEKEAGMEGKGQTFKSFGGPSDLEEESKCVTKSPFNYWITIEGSCLKRTFNNLFTFVGEARIMDLIVNNKAYGIIGGFRSLIEGAPHAACHNFIGGGGGQMGTPRSPSDPLFYLLHTNIDRLFSIWVDCHDYDLITENITGNAWPQDSIDANAPMPFFYQGVTHPMFGISTTPRDMYHIGTDRVPYIYETNDLLAALIQNTVGATATCNFNWFTKLPNAATSLAEATGGLIVSTDVATALMNNTKGQKRNVEWFGYPPQQQISWAEYIKYQQVSPTKVTQLSNVKFSDNRIQRSFENIAQRTLPTETKLQQLFFTALAECNICTSNGHKKHASVEWILHQNMVKEWEFFLPVCAQGNSHSGLVIDTPDPITAVLSEILPLRSERASLMMDQ